MGSDGLPGDRRRRQRHRHSGCGAHLDTDDAIFAERVLDELVVGQRQPLLVDLGEALELAVAGKSAAIDVELE